VDTQEEPASLLQQQQSIARARQAPPSPSAAAATHNKNHHLALLHRAHKNAAANQNKPGTAQEPRATQQLRVHVPSMEGELDSLQFDTAIDVLTNIIAAPLPQVWTVDGQLPSCLCRDTGSFVTLHQSALSRYSGQVCYSACVSE
jgi:hypothetical protein